MNQLARSNDLDVKGDLQQRGRGFKSWCRMLGGIVRMKKRNTNSQIMHKKIEMN